MKTEYRVTVKRVGLKPKHKVFRTRAGADARLLLLGPEPWKAFGKDPDARVCCSGYQCGCEGETVRGEMLSKRAGMPAIEFIAVSVRAVSDWVEESRQTVLGGCGDCDPCLSGHPEQCCIDPQELVPTPPQPR